MEDRITGILNFWFGKLNEDGREEEGKSEVWFKKSDQTDLEIREQFGDLIAQAKSGELDTWTESPKGRLATIILLDQFSRNVNRGSAESFVSDENCQGLVLDGIDKGMDQELPVVQRYFFYMPLMHSEDVKVQELSLKYFGKLRDEAQGTPLEERFNFVFGYAGQHHMIVERFGRFPHRNEVMGRQSTDEEIEFLKTPGSSF